MTTVGATLTFSPLGHEARPWQGTWPCSACRGPAKIIEEKKPPLQAYILLPMPFTVTTLSLSLSLSHFIILHTSNLITLVDWFNARRVPFTKWDHPCPNGCDWHKQGIVHGNLLANLAGYVLDRCRWVLLWVDYTENGVSIGTHGYLINWLLDLGDLIEWGSLHALTYRNSMLKRLLKITSA